MFQPAEHLIQLKSKQGDQDYLPVAWRLVWFRLAFPQGSIETEMIHLDLEKETEEEVYVWSQEKKRSEKIIKSARGVAIFRATVKDGLGGVATGTKMEKAASFGDYIEKAETGSIGRALAALGYGTQFAPELDEMPRIVDAPVDRANGGGNGHQEASQKKGATSPTDEPSSDSPATARQLELIFQLSKKLGKQPPDTAGLQFLSAKTVVSQLTEEYKEYQYQKKVGKATPPDALSRPL